jgi:hypothetical protein
LGLSLTTTKKKTIIRKGRRSFLGKSKR